LSPAATANGRPGVLIASAEVTLGKAPKIKAYSRFRVRTLSRNGDDDQYCQPNPLFAVGTSVAAGEKDYVVYCRQWRRADPGTRPVLLDVMALSSAPSG
jgi:hypothetical protein